MPIRVAAAIAVVLAFALFTGQTSNDHYRFAILGDRTGESVPGVYEQIWAEVDRAHPDFVLSVGDTIQGLRDESAAAQWSEVRRIWTRYHYPLYLAPGNHDIWSEASRTLYQHESGHPAFYSFNYQSAHFTVLDNSGSLQLADDQVRFLERDLEANRARPLKFVIFHQPFWLIPLKLQSLDFPFHRLMKKYAVRAVLSGHVHQFDVMEREGIEYIMVGSSGGHLRGHDPSKDYGQGWFYQHLEADVQGAKVTLSVHEARPPFGKGRVVDVKDWKEGGK